MCNYSILHLTVLKFFFKFFCTEVMATLCTRQTDRQTDRWTLTLYLFLIRREDNNHYPKKDGCDIWISLIMPIPHTQHKIQDRITPIQS